MVVSVAGVALPAATVDAEAVAKAGAVVQGCRIKGLVGPGLGIRGLRARGSGFRGLSG